MNEDEEIVISMNVTTGEQESHAGMAFGFGCAGLMVFACLILLLLAAGGG